MSQQFVLSGEFVANLKAKTVEDIIWHDTLSLPAYISATSALVLILHITLLSKPATRLQSIVISKSTTVDDSSTSGSSEDVEPHALSSADMSAHASGGGAIHADVLKIVRLLGCLVLFALSIDNLLPYDSGKFGSSGKQSEPSTPQRAQVALCITTAYSSLLALMSISSRCQWRHLVSKHLVVILLSLFGIYVYRDLWPLATFTQTPVDRLEGWFLWVKVIILAVIGVGIPLFMPRQYMAIDPTDSLDSAPEQTASLFSLIFYFFLDPIILLAHKVPHLSHEQLPPLADYDHSRNLVQKGFPHLDPFSRSDKRHIMWGLLYIYRYDFAAMAAVQPLQVLGTIASPIGINQLLQYLEVRGVGCDVRPWVWIIWLLVAPVLRAVCSQWYTFLATRTLVRTQGLLTQLIFNHALRIRMKADFDTSIADDSSSAEAGGSSNKTSPEPTSASGSSNKVKQKANTNASKDMIAEKNSELNVLATTDLTNIVEAVDFVLLFVSAPLLVGVSVWFLQGIFGWAAFVGLAVMVLLFPVPGTVAKAIQRIQVIRMQKVDARIQSVSETMNIIRMIKLFGWGEKMNIKIADKREDELKFNRKRQLLDLLNNNVNFVIPIAAMLSTYATYTLVMKQELTASKVFSSVTVFDLLRNNLYMLARNVPRFVQGKVSLDRVNAFLTKTELLDCFTERSRDETSRPISDDHRMPSDSIGFRDANFSWSNITSGDKSPHRRQFTLRIAGELIFKPGINLIIGPTGSGKSSMLMALLGEMHFIPASSTSAFNLPRVEGVAYAAQDSWVQNESIKENILFGSIFDKDRYQQVLYQCGLLRDLELFEAGDLTEVGEKGLTLSGGQKARITLARAVYSSAKILLLDDVLAALDVHTAKHILDKCFSGPLLKGRTIILVTHNITMAGPIANFIVSLGVDGTVISQGSLVDVFTPHISLVTELAREEEIIEVTDQEINPNLPKTGIAESNAKLIVAEEINKGHVSWKALHLFFAGLGGTRHVVFWIAYLAGFGLTAVVKTGSTWWLGYWASKYDLSASLSVNVPYYLAIYAAFLVASHLLYSLSCLVMVFGSLRASRIIHKSLIASVLGATLRWLDQTPIGRVITRCTEDIRAVDGPIAQSFTSVTEMSMTMLVKLFAIIWVTPVFAFPGIAVAALGAWCGQIYIKAQLSVKREMSNTKSPVLSHFGATMAGLISIRAYGMQSIFIQESHIRIDRYTRAARTCFNLNRWICIRIEAIGALFTASLAAYLVYSGSEMPDASSTGFSLNMAVIFTSLILWWIRLLNEFEVQANSLERIQGFISIEQESKASPGGVPPAYWPSSGEIRVEGLSARYSADGPKVLHDISFHANSGERIGVVGRTGSGKSSLGLALLRGILSEGTVYLDGLPIHSLNLEALRSNVTIIPQVPELLSGSLRVNLDPFDQYDDATLNSALHAAGLFSLQHNIEESNITLDSSISVGGSNLSVGERQILALARAIVRGSKLLILDEATSAIDHNTDNVIQASLRKNLGKDVTIITIAHRLQTIMDADKIMVLDAGRIVEFDHPRRLLQNEQGLFRALVDESGDKDHLYALAEGDTRLSSST